MGPLFEGSAGEMMRAPRSRSRQLAVTLLSYAGEVSHSLLRVDGTLLHISIL
jgi:hypothetical protein